MAARSYEISLRVLKNMARTSEILFSTREEKLVSPSDRVMLYLLYKHQRNTKPFYLTIFFV